MRKRTPLIHTLQLGQIDSMICFCICVWDYDERGKRERENYGELYTNTKRKREMSTKSVIVRNTGTDKVRE